MFQDPNTEKCAVLIITPRWYTGTHARTHTYTQQPIPVMELLGYQWKWTRGS